METPLSERLPPIVFAVLSFLACVIAAVILLAIGVVFIGIIVLLASPLVALVVWLGVDQF